MCRCSHVEVPLISAWRRRSGDAGRLQNTVEGVVVPDAIVGVDWGRELVLVLGLHSLLGLERRMLAQNASARGPERHRPSLDEARPRIVAGRPWRGGGL